MKKQNCPDNTLTHSKIAANGFPAVTHIVFREFVSGLVLNATTVVVTIY